MKLQFTKTNEGYVAEFEAPCAFNLHIKRKTAGLLEVFQSSVQNGGYDSVDMSKYFNREHTTIDCDFSSPVYPKYIKIVSQVPVESADVTIKEQSALPDDENLPNANQVVYTSETASQNGYATVSAALDGAFGKAEQLEAKLETKATKDLATTKSAGLMSASDKEALMNTASWDEGILAKNLIRVKGVNYTQNEKSVVDAIKLLELKTNNPNLYDEKWFINSVSNNDATYGYRFVMRSNLGNNIASQENVFDDNIHEVTTTIKGYDYVLRLQIDGSSLNEGILVSRASYSDARFILANTGYNNMISKETRSTLLLPTWLDFENSKLTAKNRLFFEAVGNLTIEGFDKSLKLGIFSFVKGSPTYGNRFGLCWEKDGAWVRGAQVHSLNFNNYFGYTIDGTTYKIFIDVNKIPDSETAYITDGGTNPLIKLNDRYLVAPISEIQSEISEIQSEISEIQSEISEIQSEISEIQSEISRPSILKYPELNYSATEKLIISAIKRIGFYNVPESIKNDDIFIRSLSAQSNSYQMSLFLANRRIYNETQDWNKASITICPLFTTNDYSEHEFDVTVESGEMGGMRIKILVDYSVFAGQEFMYGTSLNNKISLNLSSEYYIPVDERVDLLESKFDAISKNENYKMPMAQKNVVWMGSSNVWGDGFLSYSYLKKPLDWLYKSTGAFNGALDVEHEGTIVSNNAKYFDGKAVRISGIGAEIKFKHRGSELNICQVIERTSEYSVIGLYDGKTKVAEFTNHNKTIGEDSKVFTANGEQTKFNLDRCFTYNHTLSVDGVEKTIVLNTQGYNASFPDGVDCLVIRAMNPEGTKVIHSLWFKEAPANGAIIDVSYDYGETICFVKTTVGENADGQNESSYGDGTISYDPINPSTIGSGLDFRFVNEKAFFKYWFSTDVERDITLKIEKGSAKPYFTFNFASSVYHNVMNAGIGGYMAYTFNNETDLTAWYNIAQTFTPDFVSIGLTGNDDLRNFPRKITRVVNMTLSELREYPSLEIKSIEYQPTSDTYDVTLNNGIIAEITPRSLKSTSIIESNVTEGDFVRIGTYTGDLRQVQTRIIESVDTTTGEITWAEPLHLNEFICLDSLQDLVGQDVSIRSIEQYTTNMELLIKNILSINPKCKVCLFNIYYVDMWIRNTAEYPYIQQWIADKFKSNVFVVDAWRYSRGWVECSNKNRTLTFTANGSDTIVFDSPSYLGHWEGIEVWVDDKNVYGEDCYLITGYKNTVDPNKSGAELNHEGTSGYLKPYTKQGQMSIKWNKNIPASGKSITIKMANSQWSSDWAHPANDEYISNSLGRAMIYALEK